MIKKYIALVSSLVLGSLLFLSGCGQFAPLPDEQRYQYINAVLEELEYENTGTVIEGRYDKGDGVFSPSFYYVIIEGPETFDTLTQRMQSLDDGECYTLVSTQTRCSVGQAEITLTRDSETDTSVSLKVLDTMSGR